MQNATNDNMINRLKSRLPRPDTPLAAQFCIADTFEESTPVDGPVFQSQLNRRLS